MGEDPGHTKLDRTMKTNHGFFVWISCPKKQIDTNSTNKRHGKAEGYLEVDYLK